jgi:hypothetical protein
MCPQAVSSLEHLYQSATQEAEKTDQVNSVPYNPDPHEYRNYAALFLLLLTSMSIRHDTLVTQAKQIETNAAMQNELNIENGNIRFSLLPPQATQNQINAVQDANEEHAAQRQNLQNALITLRQTAQVTMTQASTNVNIMQQDASENTAWLQTLNTIFELLNQMTGR